MEYFTKQMWLGAQRISKDGVDEWQIAFSRYSNDLAKLKPKLSEENFKFFESADVHDGELLSFLIIDGSRPAPLDSPTRSWHCEDEFPIYADLAVLDAYDNFVWHLHYGEVGRVITNYPSEEPLFPMRGAGFGDWGYHELRDAGEGFLTHEILFSSGATLLISFKTIAIKKYTREEFVALGSTPLYRPENKK
jgi:hypothetical protein